MQRSSAGVEPDPSTIESRPVTLPSPPLLINSTGDVATPMPERKVTVAPWSAPRLITVRSTFHGYFGITKSACIDGPALGYLDYPHPCPRETSPVRPPRGSGTRPQQARATKPVEGQGVPTANGSFLSETPASDRDSRRTASPARLLSDLSGGVVHDMQEHHLPNPLRPTEDPRVLEEAVKLQAPHRMLCVELRDRQSLARGGNYGPPAQCRRRRPRPWAADRRRPRRRPGRASRVEE